MSDVQGDTKRRGHGAELKAETEFASGQVFTEKSPASRMARVGFERESGDCPREQ